MATTSEILVDPSFGVAQQAIHLERRVSMYQWRESRESKTEKKLGGGTETITTYSYSKGWSDRPICWLRFFKAWASRRPPNCATRWADRFPQRGVK